MSIQNLREARAAKAKALKELVEKPEWNAERDQPIYDLGMSEIDDLDAKIKRINDLNQKVADTALTEQVIEAAERIGKDKSDGASALYAKWLRRGDGGLSNAEWETIRNTMSTTTNSEGGFTVATSVATSVLDALKAFGGMRRVATVIQTTQGNPLQYPTSDGTSEEGEIIAENQTATDADIAFGTVGLPVYKFSSKVVTVPIELLQDSNVDIEAFVRGRIATRLARITNKMFTIGTGTNQPNGVQVAASIGVTGATGNATGVTYDALVDTQHSVDPAYREIGNTSWMMHDDSVKFLRKIKDGQQRPIFVPGYETNVPGGAPDTLLGRPIVVNQQMPVMAANAKSILFGDFSFYTIRDVMELSLFRFTDSAYTKKGQVGFLAWLRSGGNLTDVGGAIKAYRNSAT